MTLKKTKEIIGYYLEKVKVSPETNPKIQEITREFQKKGYKWLEQKVTYAGIKQRWLIVESAERKQSDIQKLNSKIEQEKNPALKLRKKLETTGFDAVIQAQNYLKSINKKLKLWDARIFNQRQSIIYSRFTIELRQVFLAMKVFQAKNISFLFKITI